MSSWFAHPAPRLLRWLAALVIRRRHWFLWPQLLLAGLCVVYTLEKLTLDPSRNNLVGGDKRYNRNFLKFRAEFPLEDELVVLVESENRERNRQFVERLGARLEAATNTFADVVYKGDLKLLGPKALLFVPEDNLASMRGMLAGYRPFLERFTRATNLVSLVDLVNSQSRLARPERSAETTALVRALPALLRILNQAADSLRREGTPPSPGIDALFNDGGAAEGRMYITYAEGRIYLVTCRAASLGPQAKRGDGEGAAVSRLRELIDETVAEVPGVNVGLTGEPVLQADEMAQSEQDTKLATIVSLVLVALIFIYGYHETGRPIKANIALLVGLAYTMAFTTAVVGHLNILTITFAPILIGLAIDFGVHLITRYEEELRLGLPQEAALEKAMVNTGMGIFTGALTTAGAFLAMGFTDFRGIREMGIICGGGLVICLLPMLTLLPSLLLRGRQNALDHQLGQSVERPELRERLERLWLDRPRAVVLATVGLTLALVIPLPRVHFDYNLLNMQSDGLRSVVYEKKLLRSANKSLLFGAFVANSLEDALRLEARLTNLPSVASVDFAGIENMARYLTEDQSRKLELVGAVKREIEAIRFRPPDPRPVDLRELHQSLFSLSGYAAVALESIPTNEPALRDQMVQMRSAVADLNRLMVSGDHEVTAQTLGAFQRALFEDVRETFETIRSQDDTARLTIADLPPTIRNRFVGVTGKFLVQAYPRKDVWQREAQEEFVRELRTVDPDVTGAPVQLLEYTSLLRHSYEKAALYALGAIAILIFLHFRRISCVFLALLPVVLGVLWMAGLMGLFGLPFNPANIMTLPLVIGVGVTNGIHILTRFNEERNPCILAKSTGKAVLVSGLTTVAGFGSLMLAQHQGIKSLGALMATGTTTCMLAGLVFLPALLTVLGDRGWGIEKPGDDNAQSVAGSGGTEAKASTDARDGNISP